MSWRALILLSIKFVAYDTGVGHLHGKDFKILNFVGVPVTRNSLLGNFVGKEL
jgi:hypothetical protein